MRQVREGRLIMGGGMVTIELTRAELRELWAMVMAQITPESPETDRAVAMKLTQGMRETEA